MSTATMTSKGQITIPKEVRDDLHLVPGSKVMFVKLTNGIYRIVPRTRKLSDLAGLLHEAARDAVPIEELNDDDGRAAADDVARSFTRSADEDPL